MALETILSQLRDLTSSTSDVATRRQLMETLHRIAYSLESADDTVHRYGYLVKYPITSLVGRREVVGKLIVF